jgi:hypothetical protein
VGDTWLVVAVVGASSMAIKAAGPVVLGGRDLPPKLVAMVAALAPALLAALVVTQVLDGGRKLVLDDRLIGLAVAAVLIAVRAPIIVIIVAAAAVTAVVRAF